MSEAHQPRQFPEMLGAVPALKSLIELRHAARILDMVSKRVTRTLHSGQQRSLLRGRGMEFEEARIYQPGDDVRSIDWRVTARTSRPHTKVYREEKEHNFLVMADLRQRMFFGSQRRFKSVVATEVGALLAWYALQHNDRVGGLVATDEGHHEIRPARSRRAVLRLLQLMCTAAATPEQHHITPATPLSLDTMLDTGYRLLRPGASVCIISDFADFHPGLERILLRYAMHCKVHAVVITDPLEAGLPMLGHPLRASDGVNTVRFDPRNKTLRERYAQAYTEHYAQLHTRLQRIGIHVTALQTTDVTLRVLQRSMMH